LAALLLATAAAAWQPAPSKAVAERIKRDAANCKRTKNLETCDDAIRWQPSDPELLVAFGDALMHTRHPADALRQYQRAAVLAPKLPGVGAKISRAEARLPKHAAGRVAQTRGAPVPASTAAAAAKPSAKAPEKAPLVRNESSGSGSAFSNDAADTHSH
jgi:hypothetical protein